MIKYLVKSTYPINPSERYPKARDFGDAFFNALTTASPWEEDKVEEEDKDTFESEVASSGIWSVPKIESEMAFHFPQTMN